MTVHLTNRWRSAAGSLAALVLAGCARSPDYDILGSLFPAWLICVALGVVLAIAARIILLRYGIRPIYPMLAYPCIAAVFTFAIWLIVY